MARAIDAENTINKLLYGDAYISEELAEYIKQVFDEQPTIEQKQEWISVEDELPKCHLTYDIFNRPDRYVSDAVLVSVKSNEVGGTRYFVGTDIMTGRTKEDIHWLHSCFYSGSAVYSQEITHWMPKPDPQKEV